MNKVFYTKRITDTGTVFSKTDGNVVWWIPEDPANTDYQDYLAWLAEGNEPELIED